MIQQNIIKLKEVLEIMDSKEEFGPFTYCTGDRKRNRGGDLITIDRAVQTGTYNVPNVPVQTDSTSASRNPNHGTHQTRNIIIRPSMQTRTISIRLITHFNGRRVIY